MLIDEQLIGAAIKAAQKGKRPYAVAYSISRAKYRFGTYDRMCTEELEQPHDVVVLWSTAKGEHKHGM